VGFVAGVKIDPVQQFIAPYQAGVAFFNSKYNKNVPVFGDYVGQYALPGTTIRVTVRAEGEALVITLPGGAESELVPVDRDWFAVAATADRLRFERGEAGRVVALRRGEDRLPRVD